MNSRTPKKTYGSNSGRSSSNGKSTRYPKQDSGNRTTDRRPRRDDEDDRKPRFARSDDNKPRFKRNSDDQPRSRRPRTENDNERKPRFARSDDDKPRFKRNSDDQPRSRRPRTENDSERKPRFTRGDDDKPRFRRDNDEQPRSRRPRTGNDSERKPRFTRSDDDKPRFKRDNDDQPRSRRPRVGSDTERKPRFTRNDDDKTRFKRTDGDKPFRSRTSRRDETAERRPRFAKNEERGFDRPKRRYIDIDDKTAPTRKKAVAKKETDETRLNKFIANSGICSRREADNYISAGLVSVNGTIITEMGFKVKPGDDVRFNGERIKGETKVYIVLNKPKDFVTTTGDPHADKTVMDLLGDRCTQRVFPVGRLDKNTTGVLLLTNDGELTEQLTHPSYNKKKIYHVFLNRKVKVADLRQLIEGIKLEDGEAQADHVEYVSEDKKEVGIEIHSGRNRIVRRMFEELGYKVEKLDRVYFAGLTKKNLKRGQWRFLTEMEINALKMGSYE